MNPKNFPSPRWLVAIALLSAVCSAGALGAEEEREELVAERTVYMKTFDNHDGTKTQHIGLEPLHYQSESGGTFEVIDPRLVEEAGWQNDANSFSVRLPQQLGAGDSVELKGGALRWRPGVLYARTLSGAEIAIAEAAPAWGSRFEEFENIVIYPDLYPGMDLLAEVRGGTLNLSFRFTEWAFSLAPEQIASFELEADFEVNDPALLEEVDTRAAEGETFEEIPLYFGQPDDEFVIALFGLPDATEHELETYADALRREEEAEAASAPETWRSNTFHWLQTGRLVHHFYYPKAPTFGPGWGTGSTTAALIASFRFVMIDGPRQRRYFTAAYSPANFGRRDAGAPAIGVTSRCAVAGKGCQLFWNYIAAGKGDGRARRAFVFFPGMKPMLDAIRAAGPDMTILDVQVGFDQQLAKPPGSVAIRTDEIIAHRALPWMFKDGYAIKVHDWPTIVPHPYNQQLRTVSNGWIKTATWSPLSGRSRTVKVDGDDLTFGSLMHTANGSSRTAATDLRKLLAGNDHPMTVILALPYDRTPCTVCTSNHPDAAVQALNGDYRVGAVFYELALEVTTTNKPIRDAQVTAQSVVSGGDRLYPGETLAWDLEMTQYSGPADVLEFIEPKWDPKYFDIWTTDPATGAALNAPRLSQVGDKVRVHVRWKRADPKLYDKVERLVFYGGFQSGTRFLGKVEIPVLLFGPVAQPTITQLHSVLEDDIPSAMTLAEIKLPATPLKATAWAEAELRWLSGPTKAPKEGVHWVRRNATTGTDGWVDVYPDQFKPGIHTLELTPCLKPTGTNGPVHCQTARKQQMTLEVRAAASPPPTPKPEIDFVSPWSIDNPSGGPVTVSIFGSDVGGASSGTAVTIPQVVTNATPLAGSTASRTNISASLSASGVCGPRQLRLTTAGGSDVHFFNVTRPFQGSPNHFATEAEAGTRSGLRNLSFPEASGGKAVGPGLADVKSSATFKMQVPATSSNYQLYVLYRTPGSVTARANATIKLPGAAGSTIAVALPATSGKDFKLASLYDFRQSKPPSTFALQAGQTYQVILSTRTGQDFPIVDMLILSDGSLPPTLAELCR
ncbi:MAG: hypothetical protein AAF481_11540 [Acidobacteriota bacterium]